MFDLCASLEHNRNDQKHTKQVYPEHVTGADQPTVCGTLNSRNETPQCTEESSALFRVSMTSSTFPWTSETTVTLDMHSSTSARRRRSIPSNRYSITRSSHDSTAKRLVCVAQECFEKHYSETRVIDMQDKHGTDPGKLCLVCFTCAPANCVAL
eukprot:GILK01010877.1.p1 GENE.GILK01010877.1~~GILK01010877.1.p1  ORF type:complete len:154 (-),score=2.58 GILK01010877.1:440-901(-)